MHVEARIPWAQLVAIAAFVFVAATYGLVLGPLSIAFSDPIHANPVSAFGKAVMARTGFIQPLVAGVTLLILGWSAITQGEPRRRARAVAFALNLYVVGYLVVELLMVGAWPFVLWRYSNPMADSMARAHETVLWPGDWRVQMVVGLSAMTFGTLVAILAMRRALVEGRRLPAES